MDNFDSFLPPEIQRRRFLEWIGLSSLALAFPMISLSGCKTIQDQAEEIPDFKNVFDLEKLSRKVMGDDAIEYLNGGADDLKTVKANLAGYDKIQIRARRLIDVSNISTKINLFGQTLETPIILSPVGFQKFFHQEGEVATAKAAASKKHQLMVSTVSNYSVSEVAAAYGPNLWFQLYPTPDRKITKILLEKAEQAGCPVCALTVDTPVVGNRETSATTLFKLIEAGELIMGNLEGILPKGMSFTDPTVTWDMITWLRANTKMKIVIKGIVTREDAALAIIHGADGIIVSNHGGRQLESNRGTIECLPEIVDEIKGRIPVLIDGGIRRGTDVFKALAMGANAVCIGRPFCWGLGALGQEGVEIALDILQGELIRDMQLAGTTSIGNITRDFIIEKE
jgi:isopentenyl diphosphate isomerase/L-lactate dehydrogenase-like FMN-dependent dehydrogenase